LAFGTIKWLGVFVFFVLLAALPETSGGKEDFVYLHLTYRILCFMQGDSGGVTATYGAHF
jgi:hypothetical protein